MNEPILSSRISAIQFPAPPSVPFPREFSVMPIGMLCPACSAMLKAPDKAEGTVIPCPRCRAKMVVPAAYQPPSEPDEVEIEEPPAKRRVPVQFNEDEPPRRRPVQRGKRKPSPRRRRSSGGMPADLKVILSIACGLLITGFFLVVAYQIINSMLPATEPKLVLDSKGNIKWMPYSAPDSTFDCEWPGGKPTESTPGPDDKILGGARAAGMIIEIWHSEVRSRTYAVTRVTFIDTAQKKGLKEVKKYDADILNDMKKDSETLQRKFLGEKTVTVGGRSVPAYLYAERGSTTITCLFSLGTQSYDIHIRVNDGTIAFDDPDWNRFLGTFTIAGT